ncbi:MAG: flagellar hook-length control protein FliK [bacterium]|jgi:flagellar hook-length control protein FliK
MRSVLAKNIWMKKKQLQNSRIKRQLKKDAIERKQKEKINDEQAHNHYQTDHNTKNPTGRLIGHQNNEQKDYKTSEPTRSASLEGLEGASHLKLPPDLALRQGSIEQIKEQAVQTIQQEELLAKEGKQLQKVQSDKQLQFKDFSKGLFQQKESFKNTIQPEKSMSTQRDLSTLTGEDKFAKLTGLMKFSQATDSQFQESLGENFSDMSSEKFAEQGQQKFSQNSQDESKQEKKPETISILDTTSNKKTATSEPASLSGFSLSNAIDKAEQTQPVQKTADTTVTDNRETTDTDKIADRAKLMLSNDRSTMVMKLSPEHLGKLEFRLVKQQNGQMMAKIKVESLSTKEVIENQMGELQKNLEDQGIQVQKISVEQSEASKEGTSFAFSQKDEQQKQQTPQKVKRDRNQVAGIHKNQQSEIPAHQLSNIHKSSSGLSFYA